MEPFYMLAIKNKDNGYSVCDHDPFTLEVATKALSDLKNNNTNYVIIKCIEISSD